MSSPPRNYDKYTYALKRKTEKDTPSPKGSSNNLKKLVDPKSGLAPLTMNRDGFAVAEDGSLQSRVVSPPLRSNAANSVHAGYTAPYLSGSNGAASPNGAAAKPERDGWARLVSAASAELSEEEISLLQWETVQGLLAHYGITNPVDIARAQLVWKRKQLIIDDNNAAGEQELSGTQTRLQTRPIESIAYGRPASPRHGGKRVIPPHKQPLKWSAGPKVDCGKTVLHN
jgi:hypothetical protein